MALLLGTSVLVPGACSESRATVVSAFGWTQNPGQPARLVRLTPDTTGSYHRLLGASQTPQHRLGVAAAADLKFAMDEILKDFRRVRRDVDVRVTYGSSGNLFAQVANGAPFDMFFSADIDYVQRLRSQNLLVPDSDFVYAVGRIVLWVRRSSLLDLARGLAVLREGSVRRVAIANPAHAPYGRAAEAAMKSMKIYDEVRSKLVFGENVAQAAQFVQSGAADAGIIALSLASSPALMKEGRFWELPLTTYPRMEQGGAILKRTRELEAARSLRTFVSGAEGRATLEKFGFVLP